MDNRKFTKRYFTNLIEAFASWEADESSLERFFEDTDYMSFVIKFANDSCVILDAGRYEMYIEWGINECPVYVDINSTYTRVGRVRNSRFWALVNRFKSHK